MIFADGRPTDWGAFFERKLVPMVLAHILKVWDGMEKPRPDAQEAELSRRLYRALVDAKDSNNLPFLIRYEDMEVQAGLERAAVRRDIVFFPCHREEIYFCLEAKRLNALISGRWESLADEYVKEGMQRFVDGRYASAVQHGGMIGYVLDGQVVRAMGNVENCIQLHLKALGMAPPGYLQRSSIHAADRRVRETFHRRSHDPGTFRIHHLFLDGQDSGRQKAGRRRTRVTR